MKPITLRQADWREACEFIARHHRHHAPPQGWKFGIAAQHRGRLVGIATIGRPGSRVLASRGYLEVTRTCTIVWGVNRLLYEACAGAAGGRGVPICTYTLSTETGESLRHAGWVPVARRPGRPSDWNTPARRRQLAIRVDRIRWEPAGVLVRGYLL